MDLPNTFAITIRSKPLHAALYAAYLPYGSYARFAEDLGLSACAVLWWVNLRQYPRSAFCIGTQFFRKAYREKVDESLHRVVGITIDECWPPEVRRFIDETRELKTLILEQTVEVPMERLTGAICRQLTVEGEAGRAVEQQETKAGITDAQRCLSYREREVIKLRYGLNGGPTYSLTEVGHIFKVTKQRIRQIEANAVRKMQHPDITATLVGL